MTDILLCTPTATFSQPEITLGIIPGGGGTQRLVSLVGKARAMDMVLTGRKVSGVQAGEWGLASRVVEDGQSVVQEAVKLAEVIAGYGGVAAQAGKEAVNAALELPLDQGLRFERRIFQSLFATADQKEGESDTVESQGWADEKAWRHLPRSGNLPGRTSRSRLLYNHKARQICMYVILGLIEQFKSFRKVLHKAMVKLYNNSVL